MKAVCGIFVLMGEFVDISENRILDNGEQFPTNGRTIEKGQRGGIVIKMSFKPFSILSQRDDTTANATVYKGKYSAQEQVFQFINPWAGKHECLPAARLHGNIVWQPAGQAVWMMAMGPVSVVGNHFTSQGTNVFIDELIAKTRNNQLTAEDLLPLFGAAVFILDLGISKDIFGMIFNNFRTIMANQNTGSAFLRNDSIREFFLSLQWLPAGNVLYTNNVTMLDLRSRQLSLAFCSQLIASLDDIAFNDNQSECASFALLREQDTTPNEGAASSFLAADILVANTVLGAVTVRANSNRFQEGTTMGIRSLFNNAKSTVPPLFSLISVGMLNTVVGNQSSYCLLLYGKKRIEEHNLIFHDEFECPCLKLNGWKKDQKERQEAEERKCWG